MLTAPQEVHSQAAKILDDWSPETLDILWAIARWYNGTLIEHDRRYQIGWHRPPDLQTLLGCSDKQWTQRYESTFQALQNPATTPTYTETHNARQMDPQPWLTDQYILRRKVSWTPTRRGRTVMNRLFAGQVDAQDIPQHDHTRDSGLIGDWDETLLHRTGVAIVAAIWRQRGRIVDTYPGDPGQARPDLYARDPAGRWQCEVLTDHNDRQLPRSKFETFADNPERHSLWLFENREVAFETLNRLHQDDAVDCRLANAPFNNPGNYSIKVGNRYITQSQTSSSYRCTAIDQIDTITGWYERHYSDAARAQLAATS